MASQSFRIIEAASAAVRLQAATAFLRQFPADQPVTIVAATRGAADDFARAIAVERGATLGVARVSLTQLAARTAVVALAEQGKTPSSGLDEVTASDRVRALEGLSRLDVTVPTAAARAGGG